MDCKLGDWHNWDCNSDCIPNHGQQTTRKREIITPDSNGGKQCDSHVESVPCERYCQGRTFFISCSTRFSTNFSLVINVTQTILNRQKQESHVIHTS